MLEQTKSLAVTSLTVWKLFNFLVIVGEPSPVWIGLNGAGDTRVR